MLFWKLRLRSVRVLWVLARGYQNLDCATFAGFDRVR
jgi:hypothetical protein